MNNAKQIEVTFSAPKYSSKEMKKAPWLRVPCGTYVFSEIHTSEDNYRLRALALNLTIVKVEVQ